MTAATHRRAPSARALLSLTGFVALGGYLLVELRLHAAALAGPLAYQARLERSLEPPWLVVLALGVVALAVHASVGIVVALREKLNVDRAASGGGSGTGWAEVVQRLSAIALVVLLGLHAARFWWPLASGAVSAADAYHLWVARLSTTRAGVPVTALVHALGLGVVAFHLSYGAFATALRRGWITTRQRRRTGPAFAILGVALFGAGFVPLVFLATGDRILFDAAPVAPEPCAPVETGDSRGG